MLLPAKSSSVEIEEPRENVVVSILGDSTGIESERV